LKTNFSWTAQQISDQPNLVLNSVTDPCAVLSTESFLVYTETKYNNGMNDRSRSTCFINESNTLHGLILRVLTASVR